jgi:hypothetical protein
MSLFPTFSLACQFHPEGSCKHVGYCIWVWYRNGSLEKSHHSWLCRVGDTLVHGLMHGEQSFGGLNDEFFDGTLVVSNRLMQIFRKDVAR